MSTLALKIVHVYSVFTKHEQGTKMNSRELFNTQYMTQAKLKTASQILDRVVDAQAHSKLALSLAKGLASVYDKQDSYCVTVEESPELCGRGGIQLMRLISLEGISFSEKQETTTEPEKMINFSASLRGGNRLQYLAALNNLVGIPELAFILKRLDRFRGISTFLEEPVTSFLSVRLKVGKAGPVHQRNAQFEGYLQSVHESWINIGSELSINGAEGRIPTKFSSPIDNGYIYLSMRGDAGLDELAFGQGGHYAVYRKNPFRDLILDNYGPVTNEEMELVKFTYPDKKILLDGVPNYGILSTTSKFLDERRYQIGQAFGLGTINTFSKEDL